MANPLETAFRLQAEGRLDEAARLCQDVLKTAPKAAGAHYVLGVIHHRRNDLAQAEKSFNKAAKLNPSDPGAQSGLAMVAREKGRLGEAETRARKALSFAPGDPNLMNGHAIILRDLNRLSEAVPLWRAALKAAPGHVEVMINLAIALDTLGAGEEAAQLLARAQTTAPQVPEVAMAMANHLTRSGQLRAAQDALVPALSAAPRHAGLLELAASTAIALGDTSEAEALAWRALGADPSRYAALNQLLDGAADRGSVLARPEAAASIASAKVLAAEQRSNLGPASQIEAGRLLDAAREFEAAAICLRRGNEKAKADLVAQGQRYDRKALDRYVDTVLTALTDHLPVSSDEAEGPAPIFVVGMPRSATSLVERIIGAHSSCVALGELAGLQDIAMDLGSPHFAAPDPAWISALSAADVFALAAAYKSHACEQGYAVESGLTPVDKNPLNLVYAPLALALWPDARIVWCRRAPADVAFSIYARHFVRPLRFDCDLADIAHYGAAFERLGEALLAHWPDRVTAIAHEDLVSEPDATIRRLLDGLELPFEEACLSPHKLKGGVATASKAQVQQPINARGVGRAARYAGLLPLPDAAWQI